MTTNNQARSQKFAMGGLFGGQLPEAGGLGAKLPAAVGTGVWGGAPSARKFGILFAKITSF